MRSGFLLTPARAVACVLVAAAVFAMAGAAAAETATRLVVLDGERLTVEDIVDIAEGRATVAVSGDGMARIRKARAVVDHYIEAGLPAYGITTMYGADFQTTLPPETMRRFGRINIVQEATRVGGGTLPTVDRGTMRAAWALLANSFARGYSGASPDLVDALVRRVNSGDVPLDVEYGNSMGDADLTANAQAALFLLADPSFELKAGEATNLLTHNFVTVALAAEVFAESEAVLRAEETALALVMEGFRANPAPLRETGSRQDLTGAEQAIRADMRALLAGSRLFAADGPRQLQDFLSLRDAIHALAALRLKLDQVRPVLEAFANSNHGSPVVLVETGELLSVPDFDTSQVTLGMDGLRQALGLAVIAGNSRGLKLISHPFIDLPSGLVAGDPDAFDGIYTRNVTYIMTSLVRSALTKTAPVLLLTESYMAEGDEDYSPAFPNSVLMARDLVALAGRISSLQALIGSVAVERRLRSGALADGDLPPALRAVQKEIVRLSPLAIPVDARYDLAPLADYWRSLFARSGKPD
jgi:histidine ammonia-lyase